MRAALIIALVLAAGCGDDEAGPSCADPATRWAFPSPRFWSNTGLVVPDDDLAGDLVREVGWVDDLEAVTHWPRRPRIVVPLDGAADAADPSRVHLAITSSAGWSEVDAPFDAWISTDGDDAYLVLQPRDPFPAGIDGVLIAIEAGAAGDARALAVCGTEQDHAANDEQWPGDQDVELFINLPVAHSSAAFDRLRERLDDEPVLVVREAEAMAPRVLRGLLDLPDYRVPGGAWALGADGAPAAAGTTSPGFIVTLPPDGEPPYPTILYQHGNGGEPLEVMNQEALADAGFAFVAIDLPEFNARAPADGLDVLSFLDFDSMARTRDNFRQTAADHLAVLAGFDALNDAIAAELEVDGALDRTRVFYMGNSLGAVSGGLTTAAARGLTASALFVGGGGYPELLSQGILAVLASPKLVGSDPRRETALAVVEAIGDAGDPIALAASAEDGLPVLFFQAVEDALVATAASDQMARAYGARLARPLDHAVAGMDEVDLPATGRVLIQAPMNDVPVNDRHGLLILSDYAQELVVHCFTGDPCEVIDTGFADH